MNKHVKALIVCSAISFIGTIAYAFITMEGVSYSPGISTAELENLSYHEASELMTDRAQNITVYEYFTTSVGNKWFWNNAFKLWLLLLIVSYTSIIIKSKWCHE